MKLRDIVTDEVAKKAVGTSDDLESPLVEPGTVLEVRHVAVENRTTAYTRLVIGVADGCLSSKRRRRTAPLPTISTGQKANS
jgi:hypothetical protein